MDSQICWLKFCSLGGFSSPPSFRVPSEWSCPLLGGTTYCADTSVKLAQAFSSSVSWSYATPQVGTGTDGGRGGSAVGAGVAGAWAPAQAASSGPGSLLCHIYWTVDGCCSCPALMAGYTVHDAKFRLHSRLMPPMVRHLASTKLSSKPEAVSQK